MAILTSERSRRDRFPAASHFLDSPRGRHLGIPERKPSQGRTDTLPTRAAVVIVGGGLAAIGLAGTLWHAGVEDVVIVDREGRLGGRFLARADVRGQWVLRSPYDHHPGVEGYRDCELLDFARLHWPSLTEGEHRQVRMAQAGHRSIVPMDVCEAYCDHVIAVHGIADRAWRGDALGVTPRADDVLVHTSLGDVVGTVVVLCTGEEAAPAPATAVAVGAEQWRRHRPALARADDGQPRSGAPREAWAASHAIACAALQAATPLTITACLAVGWPRREEFDEVTGV